MLISVDDIVDVDIVDDARVEARLHLGGVDHDDDAQLPPYSGRKNARVEARLDLGKVDVSGPDEAAVSSSQLQQPWTSVEPRWGDPCQGP